MAKLQYTDEATFKTEEVEFVDKHIELANEVHKQFGEPGIPVLVASDKKSLLIFVDKSASRWVKINIG